MSNPPPESRPSPFAAFTRPLHLGVLGAGSVAAGGALLAAGTLGTALPALAVVVLTALAYGGVVGVDLIAHASASPARPPRKADDLDGRLKGVLAAAVRLEPLFEADPLGMVEIRARVAGVLDEAREAAERTRQLRGMLAALPSAELDEDVRLAEKEVADSRDEAARGILRSALLARRARRDGRRDLAALEERGLAALSLAESVIEEIGLRLSTRAHETGGAENQDVLEKVETLHRELSALQSATAATLAGFGATR